MQAGQACNVWVRMKNTGTSYWTAANLYNLGSLNPTDNQTWGTHRVGLPAGMTTVAPNSEVTFSLTVTAPSVAGNYNFQWRTVHDGVAWFGATTPNVVVSVTAAASTGSAQVQWLISDHLGTPRIVADQTGSLAGIRRHDYLPFGEEVGAGVGGRTTAQGYSQLDGNRKKWAQLERDDETGLDYAINRYYSPMQGRFTSVDPENAGADESDPQSWNGYAYGRNNPVLYVDPDGLEYKVCDSTGKCWTHWDPNWKPVLKDTEGAKDAGVTFKGNMNSGVILDAEGNQVGTYRWVGQDYWSNATNALMYGELPRRTEAIPKTVGILYLGSVIVGATGGLALHYTPVLIGAAQSTVGLTSKAAAREAINRLGVSEPIKAAARRAIKRATSNSTIDVVKEGGNVIVRIKRAGHDGYQVIETVIKSNGVKQTVQKAYDAAGNLVHFHPK
jgi:RHS repeat-associated protein